MPVDILFVNKKRDEEIEMVFKACEMHRDYYRHFPKAHHPLIYFKEPNYAYQCAPDLTPTYLSFPTYHVKYKSPALLPVTTARTMGIPPLPGRTLAGRYNKAPCKVFMR